MHSSLIKLDKAIVLSEGVVLDLELLGRVDSGFQVSKTCYSWFLVLFGFHKVIKGSVNVLSLGLLYYKFGCFISKEVYGKENIFFN